MHAQFRAKIKTVNHKMPKPTGDDPYPDPITVVTLEQSAIDAETAHRLFRMMREEEITIRIGTDQASFDIKKTASGESLVPDEPVIYDSRRVVDPVTGEILEDEVPESTMTLTRSDGRRVTLTSETVRRATEMLARG